MVIWYFFSFCLHSVLQTSLYFIFLYRTSLTILKTKLQSLLFAIIFLIVFFGIKVWSIWRCIFSKHYSHSINALFSVLREKIGRDFKVSVQPMSYRRGPVTSAGGVWRGQRKRISSGSVLYSVIIFASVESLNQEFEIFLIRGAVNPCQIKT